MTTTSTTKPSLPLSRRGDGKNSNPTFDLSAMTNHVNDSWAQREAAYGQSHLLRGDLLTRFSEEKMGHPETTTELQQLLDDYSLPKDRQTNRTPRLANLSDRIEDLACLFAYQHFLMTGTLLPPVDWATDEEYLAGALMGLTRKLQNYGLGRATIRDAASVQAACDLTSAIMDFLLSLDFRNNHLRRKYDGTKYSLKALETLLYELAVTANRSAEDGQPPDSKKPKQESHLLPNDALQALKARFEVRDNLREDLIKKCRDGQKQAKQSIFALHRGDRDKAINLMRQCAQSIQKQLLPIVQKEPPLRTGSFASVLEEYVEAKMFAVWLHGPDVDSSMEEEKDAAKVSPSGILLQPEDFEKDIGMPLEAEEYIGGLCDLTGEIGRYAVQRGTARDVGSVKACLQANADILRAVQLMDRQPGCGKKMAAVRSSVEKLERMLYEMSLSEAAGGRDVHSDIPMDDKVTT